MLELVGADRSPYRDQPAQRDDGPVFRSHPEDLDAVASVGEAVSQIHDDVVRPRAIGEGAHLETADRGRDRVGHGREIGTDIACPVSVDLDLEPLAGEAQVGLRVGHAGTLADLLQQHVHAGRQVGVAAGRPDHHLHGQLSAAGENAGIDDVDVEARDGLEARLDPGTDLGRVALALARRLQDQDGQAGTRIGVAQHDQRVGFFRHGIENRRDRLASFRKRLIGGAGRPGESREHIALVLDRRHLTRQGAAGADGKHADRDHQCVDQPAHGQHQLERAPECAGEPIHQGRPLARARIMRLQHARTHHRRQRSRDESRDQHRRGQREGKFGEQLAHQAGKEADRQID